MSVSFSSSPAADMNTVLGGRVQLWQPQQGYRAALDPVLLAAAVPAQPHQHVLDAGMGVGTATFCLAARVPKLHLTGIEIQPDLVELAQKNAELNTGAFSMTIYTGDLAHFLRGAEAPNFDHVMTNPPYGEQGAEIPSPHLSRALAHVEKTLTLQEWLTLCGKRVKPQGTLTVIHRPDRLDDILSVLGETFGGLCLLPLWPRAGVPCKRVIVHGIKGSRAPLRLLPGLVLHQHSTHAYTAETTAILREAQGLSWEKTA